MNILLSYFIFVCSHIAICWDAETKLNRIQTIVLWLVFIYLVYTFWRAHSKHWLSRICQQGISTTSKEYFHLKCNRQELWGLGNLKTRPFCKLLNVYSYHHCLAGYPVRSFGVPLLIWNNCHDKIKDQIDHISFLQTACNYGNLKIHLNHYINLFIPMSDGIWFLQCFPLSQATHSLWPHPAATCKGVVPSSNCKLLSQPGVNVHQILSASNCVTKNPWKFFEKNPECLVRILRMEQTWQTLSWRSV